MNSYSSEHDSLVEEVSSMFTDPKKNRDKKSESSTNITVETENVGFGELLKNLKNHASLSRLKQQIEYLEGQSVAERPLSQVKQKKHEQAYNYAKRKKSIGKWMPLVSKNSFAEQLRFGDVPSEIKNVKTTSTLAATMQPTTLFEQELHQAIQASSVVEQNIIQKNSIRKAPEIEDSQRTQKLAQLRALLFQTHRKRKRLSKIHSKMWRKIYRRSELLAHERLLLRLKTENPEMFEHLCKELEQRQASHRMMKQQNARRKWGRLALRYGGQEMQKVVSKQSEDAKTERDMINRVLRTVYLPDATNEDLDDNHSSDEDYINTEQSEFNSYNNPKDLNVSALNEAQDECNALLEEVENSRAPIGTLSGSKLMNLKFMRNAFEKEELKLKSEIESSMNELSKFRKDDESVLSNATVSNNNNCLLEKLEKSSKKRRDSSSFNNEESSNNRGINDSIMQLINSSETQNILSEDPEKARLRREILHTVENIEKTTLDEGTGCCSTEKPTTAPTPKQSQGLVGWGKWTTTISTSDAITQSHSKKKVNNENENSSSHLINPVLIPRHWSRKLSNYFVKQLPHPYTTSEQFNDSQKCPLGAEWNTAATHHRLIQPKTHIRRGAVIMPLEYAKHVSTDCIDSLLDAWKEQNKNKKLPPKTKL